MPNPHTRSLATSTAISAYFVEHFIAPGDVIGVLNEAGVHFLLIGTHALGGWMQEPRGTSDVDILLAARSQRKAVKALTAAFTQLEAMNHEAGTRLRRRGSEQSLIDVRVANEPLLRAALKHPYRVSCDDHNYLIPSVEMALAMKFALLSNLSGYDPEIYQAAHDFILMARVNHAINFEELARFGEMVHPGGGSVILEKVRSIRAGEKFNL